MIERVDIGHMQSYSLRDKLEIKRRYTGSEKGMRYMIRPGGQEREEPVFEVYVWPEPFNFDKTPEEAKIREEFPYSEAGLDEICEWLNGIYTKHREEWTRAAKKSLLED